MKIACLLLLILPVVAEAEMLLPIVSVYDGDTIKTYLPLHDGLNKMSVRIYGIDTPENPAKSYLISGKLGRAKCIKEAEKALQAKQIVVDIAKDAPYMVVTNPKWGKYGGRLIGEVTINGINIAEELINKNLAVPYFGKAKTHDFCI